MAAASLQDGVQVLASTPHVRHDHPDVIPSELAGRCDELRAALTREGLELEIVCAGEVDLAWAMSASDEDLRLVTYGGLGTDVLLETPYGPLPPGFEERVFERFAPGGIRVLLAHPERSMSFQSNPGRIRDLVDRGVLVQVTAQSLLRRSSSSRSRAAARWLVKEGMAHVIASDAHGDGSRARLVDAVQAAGRIDRARARWMVTEAPAAVLAGAPLGDPPPRHRTALGLPLMRAGRRDMAYSGRVMSRLSHRRGIRKALAVLGMSACLLLPGTALAQDDEQSLPDPNASAQPDSSGAKASMPNTGVSVPLLISAGVALLAAGAAVRPIQRRRRAYRSDVWLAAVRAGSSPEPD